jgi:hypothetical protein
MASTSVVLPWSTWAMMAMFLKFSFVTKFDTVNNSSIALLFRTDRKEQYNHQRPDYKIFNLSRLSSAAIALKTDANVTGFDFFILLTHHTIALSDLLAL